MRSDTSARDHIAARDRWAEVVLLVTLTVAACDIGIILLAQVTFTTWPLVGPGQMYAVHKHWEAAVHAIIFPLSFITTICMIGTIVLRHSRVPWWMIGTSTAVQLTTLVLTKLTWAEWQHQLGVMGYVRMADGSLNPLYERIAETHWIRIMLVFIYGAVVLAMLVTAALRRAPLTSQSTPTAVVHVNDPVEVR